MKNLTSTFIIIAASASALYGISGSAQPLEKTQTEATPSGSSPAVMKDKAARFGAIEKHNLTVTFDMNKASLTATDKTSLDNLVKALPAERKRLRISIAAWSDKPFPIENSTKLSAADEKLATHRIDTLVNYLKSHVKFDSIERVNMAKKANSFATFFSTNDAKVKEAFEGINQKKPWISYEVKQFRENGGPSRAVLVIFDKVGLDD